MTPLVYLMTMPSYGYVKDRVWNKEERKFFKVSYLPGPQLVSITLIDGLRRKRRESNVALVVQCLLVIILFCIILVTLLFLTEIKQIKKIK